MFSLFKHRATQALVACTCLASPALAIPVEVELSLVVDTSGSISDDEYRLQIDSYADLVNDPSVVPQDGTVAINLVLFASEAHEAVPWTLVADAASADGLSRTIRALRRESGATALGDGILVAARTFAGNAFEGAHRVLDVSGDGPVNSGTPIGPAHAEAMTLVDVINGLPLTTEVPTLDDYFRDEVIGGVGAFAYEVVDGTTFREALMNKLLRETGGCLLPPDGVVAWYPLDEPSGNAACNAAGGAPAWLTGCPASTAGVVRGARAFDGVDDAGTADAPALQPGSPFSLVAWVQCAAGGRQPLLDALDSATMTGFALSLVDGRPELVLGVGAGTGCDGSPSSACRRFVAPALVADGAWHLVAATVDPARADGGALLVDGVRVAAFDASFLGTAATGPGTLLIGAGGAAAGGGYFAGALDEVQIVTAALTDDQASAIAGAGPGGQCRWAPSCASGEPLLAERCLWPPKHRLVCTTDLASLLPGLGANVRVISCTSDQPDDVQGDDPLGHGDGNAAPDCIVAADGGGFCVRSERQGGDADGRSYLVLLGGDAECGGGAVAARVRLTVPHDLGQAGPCVLPDPHDFLLPHEDLPFEPAP